MKKYLITLFLILGFVATPTVSAQNTQSSDSRERRIEALAKELGWDKEELVFMLEAVAGQKTMKVDDNGRVVIINVETLQVESDSQGSSSDRPDTLAGQPEQDEQVVETIPFQMVEQKPSFKGGDANDFIKWVNSQIEFPEYAKINGVKPRVIISLMVGADGNVKNVSILRGVDPAIDKEVLRIVTSSPSWEPGRQRGKPVNVDFGNFPVVLSPLPSSSTNTANFGTQQHSSSLSVKFDDPVFKSYCLKTFDTNKDGEVSLAEASQVRKIDVWRENIHSLTGIECFENITELVCSGNQLTHLDVSKNTKLERLLCDDNQLTSLDISRNTALKELLCRNDQLTHLNVSNNGQLKELWCSDNKLTSLDISKNTALEVLYCDNNQLTSLDISRNTALKTLWCTGNQLPQLDVSHNPKLNDLKQDSVPRNLPSWATEWEVETTIMTATKVKWKCILYSDGTCSVTYRGTEYDGTWELYEYNDFSDMITVHYTTRQGNAYLYAQMNRTGKYVSYYQHGTHFR